MAAHVLLERRSEKWLTGEKCRCNAVLPVFAKLITVRGALNQEETKLTGAAATIGATYQEALRTIVAQQHAKQQLSTAWVRASNYEPEEHIRCVSATEDPEKAFVPYW